VGDGGGFCREKEKENPTWGIVVQRQPPGGDYGKREKGVSQNCPGKIPEGEVKGEYDGRMRGGGGGVKGAKKKIL